MKPTPKLPFDRTELRRVRFEVTEAGRKALEEEILAEQRRSELRVLNEQTEVAS